MKGVSSLACLSLAFLADQALASCAHGTSLLKRNVYTKRDAEGLTSRAVSISTFGYLGATGPTNWHNLAEANAACANGTQQSPIDLTESSARSLPAGSLNITIPNVEKAEFENLGSTIEVVMEGVGGKTTIADKEFDLAQFHFHSPSEHTVNGEQFPLEMHMVHQAADGAIAVLAVHFQLSSNTTTPLLTSLAPTLSAISEPGSIAETGPLDFSSLISTFSSVPLLTYAGSLTTPPCTEGPVFYLASQSFPIDVETYNSIKSVVGFNSRFIQNMPGGQNVMVLAEAGKTEAETGETVTVAKVRKASRFCFEIE